MSEITIEQKLDRALGKMDAVVGLQRDHADRLTELSERLAKWQAGMGDLMVLFADYGTIGKYGAWGLSEFTGQPLSVAPKAQAVEAFRARLLPAAK